MAGSDAVPPMIVQGGRGHYQLDQFLGGGQTAAVYAARVVESPIAARVGQRIAIKLMSPELDKAARQRFFEEIETLIRLRSRLRDPALGLIEGDVFGSWLIPDVLDYANDGPHLFIAMSLAEGRPVDDILRHDWQELTEPEILTIVWQLLTAFVALHEGIKRSYYDFQPRNLFWDQTRQALTIIDWNLLSAEGNIDAASDVEAIASLLCRLATGANAVIYSGSSAGSLRQRDLSLAMQSLLDDLLAPDNPARASARSMRDRVGITRALWAESGDQLLIRAAQSAAAVEAEETAAAKWAQTQQLALLMDLAARRSYSPTYAVLVQGLRSKLQSYQDQWSWLGQGRTFLKLNEFATAEVLFVESIVRAVVPAAQLTGWRWLTIVRAAALDVENYQSSAAACADAMAAIGDVRSWVAVDWTTAAAAVAAITWPGAAAICQELNAYAILQPLLARPFAYAHDADGPALAKEVQALRVAIDLLDSLPGRLDETQGYAQAAWAWLGSSDSATARQQVLDRLKGSEQRSAVIDGLDAEVSGLHSPGEAADLLAAHPGDGYLARSLLACCRHWLAEAANDAALDSLLSALRGQTTSVDVAQGIQAMQSALHQLQELHFWIGCVEAAGRADVAAQAQAVTTQETTAADPVAESEGEPGAQQLAASGAEILIELPTDFGGVPVWRPNQIQQAMLFISAQVQKIAELCSSVPGLQERLDELLNQLATAAIAGRHGGHVACALLERYASTTPHLPALLSLAKSDQAIEEKLRSIEQQTHAAEAKLAELHAQVAKNQARKQELEQKYLNLEARLRADYTRKNEELEKKHVEALERQERAANDQRLRRTEELRKLDNDKSAIKAEIDKLNAEKSNLEREIARQRRILSQPPAEPAAPAPASSEPPPSPRDSRAQRPVGRTVWTTGQIAAEIFALKEQAAAADLEGLSTHLQQAAARLHRQFNEDFRSPGQQQDSLEHLLDFALLAELQTQLLQRSKGLGEKEAGLRSELETQRSEIQRQFNMAKEAVKKQLAGPKVR